MISAKEAIMKLEEGNRKYLTLKTGGGDILRRLFGYKL